MGASITFSSEVVGMKEEEVFPPERPHYGLFENNRLS
jgi:hypothetical protein